MIPEADARAPGVWLPPALLAGVSTVVMLGGRGWHQALEFERAGIAAGQWWRLFSGNFVHLSWLHWLANVLSLVLLVLLCPERRGAGTWLIRLMVLGLGVGLGLYWLDLDVPTYVGLSGMVYGLFALGFARQALEQDELGVLGLVFVLVRIGWELLNGGASDAEMRLLGGAVVPQSHLYGVAAAVIYGLAARAASALNAKRSSF